MLVNSFPLLAVPLFIMVGYLANAAGMADRLILGRYLRYLVEFAVHLPT